MSFSLETLHRKIGLKFECGETLLNYIKNILEEFDPAHKNYYVEEAINQINILENKFEILRFSYENESAEILQKFYIYSYGYAEINNKIRELEDKFQETVILSNYIDTVNDVIGNAAILAQNLLDHEEFAEFARAENKPHYVAGLPYNGLFRFAEYLKYNFRETAQKIFSINNSNYIQLSMKAHDISICGCGAKMDLYSDRSEYQCPKCGKITKLEGTIFEDNCYAQQGGHGKKKLYDYTKHCTKCLNQILGESVVNLSEKIKDRIDKKAVQEYTRGSFLRPMDGMRCSQLREWLKDLRLSKLNPHAPYIRRLITGMHGKGVSPPSLTVEEKENILGKMNKAMQIFEQIKQDPKIMRPILSEIGKDRVDNKPFYQYICLKILREELRKDLRLPGIIDCIHFQSAETLIKDDMFWKHIAPRLGYDYHPTDRTAPVRYRYF